MKQSPCSQLRSQLRLRWVVERLQGRGAPGLTDSLHVAGSFDRCWKYTHTQRGDQSVERVLFRTRRDKVASLERLIDLDYPARRDIGRAADRAPPIASDGRSMVSLPVKMRKRGSLRVAMQTPSKYSKSQLESLIPTMVPSRARVATLDGSATTFVNCGML